MSPLRKTLIVLLPVALLAFGCSKKNENVLLHPSEGHNESWLTEHGGASQQSDCSECHGEDLTGGISLVSCFASSIDGTRCHGSGPGTRHPQGWASPSFHGPPTKAAPGPNTGFESCQSCHGEDYSGGIVDLACQVCHGVPAPHPSSPWRNGRPQGSHTNTNTRNAPVCADCHRERAGTPGCYNNTLCHGQRNAHPAGWASSAQHGAEAKKNPGNSGFSDCQECHGKDFRGGESGVSCFKCHTVAPHSDPAWRKPLTRTTHTNTGQGNAPVCADCHREKSGTPGCFNGTLCHGDPDPHPSPTWNLPAEHGGTAKAAPGSSSGFGYCGTVACHGNLFNGGATGPTCFTCHPAPHPAAPWRGGPLTHVNTNLGNNAVCERCHDLNLGVKAGGCVACHKI